MSKYLVTLRPITPYFFGGENTFGEDNQNYHAKSIYLPQQTTLLGFLRYELLRQNNLLGTNAVTNKWSDLIGESSFQCKNKVYPESYGAIKMISPVFLSNGEQHYISQAMDWAIAEAGEKEVDGFKVSTTKLLPLSLSFGKHNAVGHLNKSLKEVPEIFAGTKHFNPKHDLKSLWVISNGSTYRQWDWEKNFEEGKGFENGLFIEKNQVGITRNLKKKKEDVGEFYKQTFYELGEGFGFAFFADIDLPEGKKFEPSIVTMGGEKSAFEMTIDNNPPPFTEIFTSQTFTEGIQRSKPAIVLTSDAYIAEDFSDDCDFAITDQIPFRNIITVKNDPQNYAQLDRDKQSGDNNSKRLPGNLLKQKELLYLLKRGSIFYADDTTALENKLKNQEAFRTIGYNHYQIIQPSKKITAP